MLVQMIYIGWNMQEASWLCKPVSKMSLKAELNRASKVGMKDVDATHGMGIETQEPESSQH